jgi:glutathione S-transferase
MLHQWSLHRLNFIEGHYMLKIWGRLSSSNVQKVVVTADELGLSYERIDAGGAFGKTKEPEYIAMNPNGMVPTIEHDDFVLWESNSIVRYLCNTHSSALSSQRLYPTDPKQRADIERWMDWGHCTLGPAILDGFWHMIRTPAAERQDNLIQASYVKTAAALALLESRLSDQRAWLCGTECSLADIVLMPHVHRWFNMPWTEYGCAETNLPKVKAWYTRATLRPTLAKWVKVTIT